MWGRSVAILASVSLIAAAPDTADEHFARAAQLVQAGLKLRPTDLQAWNNLGVLYFQQQDLQRAISAFEQAHRLDARNSEVNFNLGLALSNAGQAQRAIAYLADAAQDGARASEARFLIGTCWFDLGEWRRAITELELARNNQTATP